MNDPWTIELSTPSAIGLLAALRRRDPGLPAWESAVVTFADYGAQTQQDRIMRALVAAYQSTDLRAGPVIVALLWRRLCARCNGDQDAVQSLVVAVLEVCLRYEHTDRDDLPMRLVSAAQDRERVRGPAIKTVPLAELLPDQHEEQAQGGDDLLSPAEAAGRLGVHGDTLHRWSRKGLILPIRTPTGRYKYPSAEVERLRSQGPPVGV